MPFKCVSIKDGKSQNKICLTLINGTGFVFDANHYIELRTQHRIIGSLIGLNKNDQIEILPAALTAWETRLLVEKGIAFLVSKTNTFSHVPTDNEILEEQKKLETRMKLRIEALKSKRLLDVEGNIDKIIAGKRKKLLKQGIPIDTIDLKPSKVLKEIEAKLVFECTSRDLGVLCAFSDTHTGRIALPPHVDLFKYNVFRDLWLRKKFITSGENFGGDLLVYPGDPMLYHASHVIVLLPEGKINLLELVAKVRLSVAVNKVCILAYYDDALMADCSDCNENKEHLHIKFKTISWKGNWQK